MILFVIAALPAVVWVGYVMQAASPDGNLRGEVFYSLADSAQAHRPPDPLLFRTDFYRQIFDDLSGVVLTPVAFMLPPIAVMAGLGWARLEKRLHLTCFALCMLLALAILASFRFTAGPLLKVPDEDRSVLPAAQKVRDLAVENEPVVTMHGSGIDLLYYGDRPGWALEPDDPNLTDRLNKCAEAGAKLLVIVDVEQHTSPDRNGRLNNLTLINEGDGFRLHIISRDL